MSKQHEGGKRITASKEEAHKKTVQSNDSFNIYFLMEENTQTAARAVTTASVSDFYLHLDGETRSPRAAVLHDPHILMHISIYMRAYGSNSGTRSPTVPHYSGSGIKVCGGAHGLKISRFTCQLWSVVVNLILWKNGSRRCVKVC